MTVRGVAALAALGLAISPPSLYANGRNSGTSTINFRHGNDQDIAAGMTFGLLLSHDGGATWQWICEDAVGFSGTFDPDFDYAANGSLFATTLVDGLRLEADGCTFAATPSGTTKVTQVQIGPDGAVYYAASDPADVKIYKSTDSGVTFPQSAMPPGAPAGTNWQSLAVAPSDPQRIYLSGYQTTQGNPNAQFLYRSIDGGVSFVPIASDGLLTTTNTTIDIAGIDPIDPDIVYIRVEDESSMGQGLYKTTNGGASGGWTHIRSDNDAPLVLLVRPDSSLVEASPFLGARTSSDGGATWTELPGAPHLNCLFANSAGQIWGCTVDLAGMGSPPPDGWAIMKTDDLVTWTGVLKFTDIQAPVSCPAGTVQQDQCVLPYQGKMSMWCIITTQLGITAMPIDCAQPMPEGAPVHGGCCDSGGGAANGLLGGFIAMLWIVRRRRTPC